MPRQRETRPTRLPKVPTGVRGLDELTHGGVPRGRATLVSGGAGSGKTLLALQTAVHAVRDRREAVLFVSFEEDPERLKANAASLGWDLPRLERRGLHFLDARLSPELVHAGGFDLQGLLAMLDAKARRVAAGWIVLDALDMLLALLPDAQSAKVELLRLHDWLVSRNFTVLLTTKVRTGPNGARPDTMQADAEFLVDCVLHLTHRVVNGISLRHLRVGKFRGSAFAENEAPLLITPEGIEVAGLLRELPASASSERVSSGIADLDRMLGGGYYRGASVLVTGAPGTAKSTLAGAFAEAACRRGESTLFVSFDSGTAETVRNLASVGIRLERFRRRGLLHMHSASHVESSPEVHFRSLRQLVAAHQVRCLVIDPLSSFGKHVDGTGSHAVAERIARWAKGAGLTVLSTSLTAAATPEAEATPMQISTIADTWIHLSYRVSAGERNRALTIIKSRGTPHSNQVRELILATAGLTLADVFTAGGEVLMGTMRWEREEAVRDEATRQANDAARRAEELQRGEEELREQLQHLQQAIARTRAEREALLLRQSDAAEHRQARTAATHARRDTAAAPASRRRRP